MQIAVFRFRVSNATSSAFPDDYKDRWFKEKFNELKSEEDIEYEINTFLEQIKDTHKVVNIDIKTIDVHYHNNGRGNTIDLIYTIMYTPYNEYALKENANDCESDD